jgi:DNA repair protein SbcD/Mre11
VRLLLFSDLHLDTPFVWAGPALARARRQALRDTLLRIVALAEELDADALCCAGDLYEHERFTPDTGEFLRATFTSADRPVLLVPGNHDWYGPASLYAQTAWSPNVVLFTGDRLVAHELVDGFTVWGAAHRAPANTDGFLDRFTVDRDGVSVGLFHGSERAGVAYQEQGKAPHAPFNAAQIETAGLAHALVGHFHTPYDGDWHTYPGNPDPLAFGEQGLRAAVLLEVSPCGQVTHTRHPVASTVVEDVELRLDGARHTGEVREAAVAALAGRSGIVRLTVTGNVESSLDVHADDLRSLGGHLDGLLVRLRGIRADYDLDALSAEPTVRGQFVRDVLADISVSEDLRRKVITTGLRALDGRRDELEVV